MRPKEDVMAKLRVCPWCRQEETHSSWCHFAKLEAVAAIAHEYVMKGGRPGRVQLMAKALADAGYDVGQHKDV